MTFPRKYIRQTHHKRLSVVSGPHNLLGALVCIFSLLIAFGGVALGIFGVEGKHFWLVLPALLLIGSGQHHVSIVMHDAIHALVFSNRSVNDFVGLYTFGGLVGSGGKTARAAHLSHHAFLGTEEDQEQGGYLVDFHSPQQFIFWLFAKLFAIDSVKRLIAIARQVFLNDPRSEGIKASRQIGGSQINRKLDFVYMLLVQLILFVVLSLVGYWWAYFVFWLLPLFTITRLLMGIRSVGEHRCRIEVADLETSYLSIFRVSVIERFFLAPLGFQYHSEHHLFPRIPSWCLHKVAPLIVEHKDVKGRIPVYGSYIYAIKDAITLAPSGSSPK